MCVLLINLPPVVTVNVVTPIVRVPEKDGEARVCARKDVETAQSVTSFLITSPGKAQGLYIHFSNTHLPPPIAIGSECPYIYTHTIRWANIKFRTVCHDMS